MDGSRAPDLGDNGGLDWSDLAPPRWSRFPSLLPWCSLLWQGREGLKVGRDVGFIFWDTAWPHGETQKKKHG